VKAQETLARHVGDTNLIPTHPDRAGGLGFFWTWISRMATAAPLRAEELIMCIIRVMKTRVSPPSGG